MRGLLVVAGIVIAVVLVVLFVPGVHEYVEARVFDWVASSAR